MSITLPTIKFILMLLSLFPFCYWICNHEYKVFVAEDDYDELMSEVDTIVAIRNQLLKLYSIFYSIPVVLCVSLLYFMEKWRVNDGIINGYGVISAIILVASCIFCFVFNTYYCFIDKTPNEDAEDGGNTTE